MARMAVLEMTEFDDEPLDAAPRAMVDFDDGPDAVSSGSAQLMTDFDDGDDLDWGAPSISSAPDVPPALSRLAKSQAASVAERSDDMTAARWKQKYLELRSKMFKRELPGWTVSLALHLLIMLGLLSTQLPGMPKIDLSSIINTELPSEPDSEVVPPRLEELAFKTEATKQFGSDSDINTGITGGSMATMIGDNPATGNFSVATVAERINGPGFKPSVSAELPAPPSAELLSNVNVKGAASEHAGGVEGAIDRLAFEIGASLRERRTLVIWMFDASLSLRNRREMIAERFENVYNQLHALDVGADKALKTGVMWFGEKNGFVTQEPVDDIRPVVEQIRRIPDDTSGKEYVFSALSAGLRKFAPWGKAASRNVMVIVVTDEKGDDDPLLEQAIHYCRVQARARCYVVGNAAPFGRQKGYVHWRYDDGKEEDIEVDQGPETILPEALQLGFWGGDEDNLERMSSSYGPYALTRLCAETGGLFLITEDDRRSKKFDPQIMRNYAPDYRPIADYQKGVEKNKAKSSLVAAATKAKLEAISLPKLDFRADTDGRLREELTEAQKPAAEMDYRLLAMHSLLVGGVKDRDKLTESRWKAGYDLAMGRVLAMRVRVFGYNKMLAEMKVQPKVFESKGDDQWVLVPSDQIVSGPDIKKMAKEAKMYLNRVVDDHPGTPWALMAQRELSTELGWEWQPRRMNYAARDRERAERAGKQIRLADDDPKKKQMRQKEQKREKPKL
jgi:hypothetical protein